METVQLAYDVYESEETQGAGKCPIILLHGLFWNKYMFRDLAKALCSATQRKVFCLDLRCHDESPFREDCDADRMAEDVKRFVRERELEKVAFVCHSFSCTVAYLVVVDQPETVEKVVMIDHPPYPEYTDKFYDDNVLPQFVAQNRFLKTLDPSLSLTAAKKKIMSLSKGASEESHRIFLRKIAYELTKVSGHFKWKTDHEFLINKYREGAFRPAKRGSSNHEILIIRCNDSLRVPDKKFAAVLRFNPNAKLISINDATHLLMFEKQEEFVAAVEDFMS